MLWRSENICKLVYVDIFQWEVAPMVGAEDSSAGEQPHTGSSLRKECLDRVRETEDVGNGGRNSCSLDGKLHPGI